MEVIAYLTLAMSLACFIFGNIYAIVKSRPESSIILMLLCGPLLLRHINDYVDKEHHNVVRKFYIFGIILTVVAIILFELSE